MENQASLTICATTGSVLTETVEGVTMPADYSFASVNDYVHGVDRLFEELQWLCLGMATEIEKMQKDAGRYRWLKDRLFGADFNWNESGTCALVFEWPKESPVSANCDRTIDDAMLKTPNVVGKGRCAVFYRAASSDRRERL